MESDEDYVFDAQTAAMIAKDHGRQIIFQYIREKAERGKTKMLVKISQSVAIGTEKTRNGETSRLHIPLTELKFLSVKGYEVSDYDPYDDTEYRYVSWGNDS